MPLPAASRWRHIWRTRGPQAWLLRPVAALHGALVRLRVALYRRGVFTSHRVDVPVVVVGNVIAGGAGKTPVTIAIVQHLQRHGWQPGVISRGYGRSTHDCRAVLPDSSAHTVGDEPALIARTTGAPVFVARQRIEAARALRQAHPQVNVLVCDDGLQHLALARDVEVCVFNDEGVGNGWLLPAGPLREPWPRQKALRNAPPLLVVHAGPPPPAGLAPPPAFAMQRRLADHALDANGQRTPWSALRGTPLHALAAIARPEDFFAMLRAEGVTLASTIALPDHYDFGSALRTPDLPSPLICTEKDMVKLWPHRPDVLAAPLHVQIDAGFFTALDAALSLSS